MKVSKEAVVGFEYVLKDERGEILDQSGEGQPLYYIQGAGNIVPGLENAMEGRSAGDSFQVKVEPAEGYGERDEELVMTEPRKNFANIPELTVGMELEAETDAGPQVMVVTRIDDEEVELDANHPLAGSTLDFSIKLVEVRAATAEEKAHGHVHGPGGHHH